MSNSNDQRLLRAQAELGKSGVIVITLILFIILYWFVGQWDIVPAGSYVAAVITLILSGTFTYYLQITFEELQTTKRLIWTTLGNAILATLVSVTFGDFAGGYGGIGILLALLVALSIYRRKRDAGGDISWYEALKEDTVIYVILLIVVLLTVIVAFSNSQEQDSPSATTNSIEWNPADTLTDWTNWLASGSAVPTPQEVHAGMDLISQTEYFALADDVEAIDSDTSLVERRAIARRVGRVLLKTGDDLQTLILTIERANPTDLLDLSQRMRDQADTLRARYNNRVALKSGRVIGTADDDFDTATKIATAPAAVIGYGDEATAALKATAADVDDKLATELKRHSPNLWQGTNCTVRGTVTADNLSQNFDGHLYPVHAAYEITIKAGAAVTLPDRVIVVGRVYVQMHATDNWLDYPDRLSQPGYAATVGITSFLDDKVVSYYPSYPFEQFRWHSFAGDSQDRSVLVYYMDETFHRQLSDRSYLSSYSDTNDKLRAMIVHHQVPIVHLTIK